MVVSTGARWLISSAIMLAAALVVPPPATVGAATTVDVTVDGATSFPAFDVAAIDYAIRCDAGQNALTFTVDAPGATAITVNGDPANSGDPTGVVVVADDLVPVSIDFGTGPDTFWYRCLPVDFPALVVERPGTPSPGYYLVSLGLCFFTCPPTSAYYLAMLDTYGVPLWYKAMRLSAFDQRILHDGNIAFSENGPGPAGYSVIDWNGNLQRMVRTVDVATDGHDFIQLANGHEMLMSYPVRTGVDLTPIGLGPSETVYDGRLQEIDSNGNLVWDWYSENHIEITENITGNADLVHLNSVEELPGGDLLVSGRAVGVYRIDRATGNIEWKLGGTPRAESLTVIGDAKGGPLLQHDARVLPDGTITIFDNRSTGEASRVVQYEIDEGAGTATLIWSYEHASGSLAFVMGNARRQDDGNTIIGWGSSQPIVEEIDSGGVRQFAVTDPGGMQYRVVKYPLAIADVDVLRASAGGVAETDAPLDAVAVAGNRSATVSWSAPTTGGPITGYTVEAVPGGQTCTTSGARSCVVAGLTAGDEYRFTVRAANKWEASLGSRPSTAVMVGPECAGSTVTVDLRAGESPTNGDDVILGTAGPDVIEARAGDDLVCAGAGDDIVKGGFGADTIRGGTGGDELAGGDGDDTLFGHAADDELRGKAGGDLLLGNAGEDTVVGGDGDDELLGGRSADRLIGGPGEDEVRGEGGDDSVFGNGEDDRGFGGEGTDRLFGGLGDDQLRGQDGRDTVTGGQGADELGGGAGVDVCNGSPDVETDVIRGGCETILNIP